MYVFPPNSVCLYRNSMFIYKSILYTQYIHLHIYIVVEIWAFDDSSNYPTCTHINLYTFKFLFEKYNR